MADPFSQATLAIEGDPELALIAQVNRWTARAGQPAFPLAKPITPMVAGYAIQLLQQRFSTSLLMTADLGNLSLMMTLSKASADPVAYVTARTSEIAQTLARYGDSIGLPPATVGITVTTPVKMPWWRWPLIIGLAGLGVVGGVSLHRRLKRA